MKKKEDKPITMVIGGRGAKGMINKLVNELQKTIADQKLIIDGQNETIVKQIKVINQLNHTVELQNIIIKKVDCFVGGLMGLVGGSAVEDSSRCSE